ncbi:cytochrome B [Pedobacter chitinilyticus]|uniref:Cytochrome B n=1 Tax=Pedobacter chitinilyticus TaxID=2233776 RepID=A0A443YU29_9SPHI|nr:cytochrome B [Pedobacter chitinilyticus]RWU07380.1 cytochrome B [Pedobacter chitinilyticus]
MNLYGILKSAHSGWRYIVLILLVVALLQALAGWLGKKGYTEGNRKLNVFTLISAHIQFLFGLILYFLSPLTKGPSSEALYRYWKMEHIAIMLLAVILITVGNSKSKKITDGVAKHKAIAIFFGLALILIIGSIFMMVKNDPSRTLFGVS